MYLLYLISNKYLCIIISLEQIPKSFSEKLANRIFFLILCTILFTKILEQLQGQPAKKQRLNFFQRILLRVSRKVLPHLFPV